MLYKIWSIETIFFILNCCMIIILYSMFKTIYEFEAFEWVKMLVFFKHIPTSTSIFLVVLWNKFSDIFMDIKFYWFRARHKWSISALIFQRSASCTSATLMSYMFNMWPAHTNVMVGRLRIYIYIYRLWE